MSRIDRLFEESSGPADFIRRYADYLSRLLADLDVEAVARVATIFDSVRRKRGTIFLIGNGGSASTASHFANDLALGTRLLAGGAYRAVSLTDNVALISAAANDLGYETVFVEQLRPLLTAGDVLVAISASGNSANLLRAVEYANDAGAITVAFTGFDGGRLRSIAQTTIHVPTPDGDYGPVEDMHLVLDHMITSYLARAAGTMD